MGAALNRLIEGLYEGGVQQKGSELDSGKDANVAIIEFNFYLNTLDDETKKQLMEAHIFDRFDAHTIELQKITVESHWERLARPTDTDYENTSYCVELIAASLKEILEGNPQLYELMSYQGSAVNNLSELNEAVLKTHSEMLEALPFLKKHQAYENKGDEALLSQLLEKIHKKRRFQMSEKELVWSVGIYISLSEETPIKEALKKILQDAGQHYPKRILKQAIQGMPESHRMAFKALTLSDSSRLKLSSTGFFHAKRKTSLDKEDEQPGQIRKKARCYPTRPDNSYGRGL